MAVASTMHILIVEDHSLVREFFAYLIRSIRSDTCIVEAGNAAEALAAAPTRRFAFVLFGLPTGDQAHLMALQALRRHSPDALVALISAQADSESMMKALSLGACACLPKSANSQCVRQWLKQLFADQMAIPRVVKGLLGETTQDTTAAAGSTAPNLTGRQSEVLALVVAGLPNKLIARKLEIAESTVKLHVSAILRELKVSSRTQAMATVAKAHLVLPVIHDLGAPRVRQAPRPAKRPAEQTRALLLESSL